MRACFRYAEYVAPRRGRPGGPRPVVHAPRRGWRTRRLPTGCAFEVERRATRSAGSSGARTAATRPHDSTSARVGGVGAVRRVVAAARGGRPPRGHVRRPAHGDSDAGPAGPGQPTGSSSPRPWTPSSAVRPAEAVVAHSMGTISTYLAMRYGWLGAERLVFIAPMVESESLFDQFQRALGFGPRVRAAFDRAVDEFVGVTVPEFDARVQAQHVDALPTLVITDRGDRQTAVRRRGRLRRVISAAGHHRRARASQDPSRPCGGRSGWSTSSRPGRAEPHRLAVEALNAATRRRGPCGGAAPGDVPGSPAGRVAAVDSPAARRTVPISGHPLLLGLLAGSHLTRPRRIHSSDHLLSRVRRP